VTSLMSEKYGTSTQEVKRLGIDAKIKKTWIEIQKRHEVPVNAIGAKIDPRDTATLRIWRDEGIDKFVRK